MKKCRKCEAEKPLTDFYPRGDGKGRDGHQSHCRACVIEANNNSPGKPFQDWKRNLKVKYGITPCQYSEMYAAQRGCCAICGSTETGVAGQRTLSVDHCHDTGVIRGLLCMPCNTSIGRLNTPELLAKASEYLTQTRDGASVVPAKLVKKAG